MCQVQTLQLATMKRANGKSHTTNHDLKQASQSPELYTGVQSFKCFLRGHGHKKKERVQKSFRVFKVIPLYPGDLEGWIDSLLSWTKHINTWWFLNMSPAFTGWRISILLKYIMQSNQQPNNKATNQSNQSNHPINETYWNHPTSQGSVKPIKGT